MDLKQGYECLSKARDIDYQIKDQIAYIDSLYECCGLQGISYDKISVVSSPENKFERIMAEIDVEKRKLDALYEKKEKAIKRIKKKIDSLNPSPEKTILMLYFIGCKDMKEISKEIKYELKYCYRLRKKGIKSL